jgi:hypothetical protein
MFSRDSGRHLLLLGGALALGVCAGACGGEGGGSADAGRRDAGDVNACADRTGGALIHFRICDEDLTVWMTDEAFIDEALVLEGAEEGRIPNFFQVVKGTDCDPQWSWHVSPSAAEWADFTIELCDGCPWYIEENLDDWVDQVGGYCPWLADVVSVDDRR